MRLLCLMLFIALTVIWLSGCSQFDAEAQSLRERMTYVENPEGIGQWEHLTEENNFTGDYSNYAASLDDIEGVRVWYGHLNDGRDHAMACNGLRCYDTIINGSFAFNPDRWSRVWTLTD